MVTAAVAQRYPPDPAVISEVRAFVADQLRMLGLDMLIEDARLLVSEVATNVVLHARSEFGVEVGPVPGGARIEVADGFSALPGAGMIDVTSATGRGLVLVDTLAVRWGVGADPGVGKRIWFELGTQVPDASDVEPDRQVDDADEAMGAVDDREPASPADRRCRIVIPAIPVGPLVKAKARLDDLLRELQLIVVGGPPRAERAGPSPDVLDVAARLDVAAQAFADARHQVRSQALAAWVRGDTEVTLDLRIPVWDLHAARQFRDACEEAVALGPEADLLVPMHGVRSDIEVRRMYLDAVIEQLELAASR